MQAALDVSASAIDVASPFLAILDRPTIDPGAAVRAAIGQVLGSYLSGELVAFHIYPESAYKIHPYRRFELVAANSLLESQVLPDAGALRAIMWVIVADTADDIVSQSNAIMGLLGLPPISFEETSITRDPMLDYIDNSPSSFRPIDALPGLRDVLEGMDRITDQFTATGGFSNMASGLGDLLREKSATLGETIDAIEAAIAALKAVNGIALKRVVLSTEDGRAGLASLIPSIGNSPGQTQFAAGSIFVYEPSMAAIVEALL